MKTLPASLLVIALLGTAGCFTYERRTAPVIVESSPAVTSERVVTVLPSGYRTRVYRGTTYYYTSDKVYRSTPSGHVITTRPW